MSISNVRVAAVLCQEKKGVTLVATHVPAKADPIEDYSQTTLTGPVLPSGDAMSAMQRIVREQLGVGSGGIAELQLLALPHQGHRGKVYIWCFVRLRPETNVIADKREIQSIIWNSPQQLSTSLPLMSDGRREMFFLALHAVTAKGLLGRGYNHQLLQQMQNTMEMPLRA